MFSTCLFKLKRSSLLFILLSSTMFSFITVNNCAAEQLKDLTILVSSCDKYASLWDPFFGALFNNWRSLNVGQENSSLPIMLIANTKAFDHPRVNNFSIAQETSWTDNLLAALEQVNTPYVILFLDDYWINVPVDEQRLQEIYQGMQASNAAFVQISCNDLRYQDGEPYAAIPGVVQRKKFGQYKASLQLAIWRTDALRFLLKPGENPWEFEQAGTIRSHGYNQAFLTVAANEPIKYVNATHQGHLSADALDFIKINNLAFHSELPVEGDFNWRLFKAKWQHRFSKTLAFFKNPGSFYQYIN